MQSPKKALQPKEEAKGKSTESTNVKKVLQVGWGEGLMRKQVFFAMTESLDRVMPDLEVDDPDVP